MGTGNSKVVDVPVPVVVPPKKEKADLSNTIKLILLGAGDCGKTTIFKQLVRISCLFLPFKVEFYWKYVQS